MDDRTTTTTRSISWVLVIGLLQGLLLWWLEHSKEYGAWPGMDATWFTDCQAFGILIGPLIYAVMPWWHRPVTWGWLGALAALLLLSGWQFAAHAYAPDSIVVRADLFSTGLLLLQLLLLFHAVPFLQSYLRERRWHVNYRQLFLDTWQNALHLALATLFAGIFWVLLWLCAMLFKMIGLPVMYVLLFEISGYAWLILALSFGVGFHLVGSAERLLTALRQQVLMLLKWLVPVAALILVAFSVALLFRAPTLFNESKHVISAVWLLWLVTIAVYLYNTAYQDGSVDAPYPTSLGRILRWTTPLLVLLSGMAAYDLWVRIDAYGMTGSRYWGGVIGLICLSYSIGYAVAGFRPGSWMAGMGIANIRVALGIVVILALTFVPVLSPQRLTAHSQAARLARSAGIAEAHDFMWLRFDAGAYGYDELKRLASDGSTPVSIRNGARAALQVHTSEDRYKFAYTTVLPRKVNFETFPGGTTLEPALKQVIENELPRPSATGLLGSNHFDVEGVTADKSLNSVKLTLCSEQGPCPVLFVDLDADQQAEAILFTDANMMIYQKNAGDWLEVANSYWRPRGRGANRANENLLKQLRAGNFRIVLPRWRALEVGHARLELGLLENFNSAAKVPGPRAEFDPSLE